MFKLRTDMLAAASIAASTEPTRYYLNGVYVEPHPQGVLMVATDGHRLHCFLDTEGHADRPAILTMDFKAKITKATAKEKKPRYLTFDLEAKDGDKCAGSVWKEDHNEGFISVIEIDGVFPQFRRIVPAFSKSHDSFTAGFNATYLADVQRALSMIVDAEGKVGITINQSRANEPALITTEQVKNGFAVVMPNRIGTLDPTWVHEEQKIAAE